MFFGGLARVQARAGSDGWNLQRGPSPGGRLAGPFHAGAIPAPMAGREKLAVPGAIEARGIREHADTQKNGRKEKFISVRGVATH